MKVYNSPWDCSYGNKWGCLARLSPIPLSITYCSNLTALIALSNNTRSCTSGAKLCRP